MSKATSQASLWAALVALLFVSCDSPPPTAVEVAGVAYVNERRRSADDVARVSEAFYAQEQHGSDVVFRTEENVRPGYYFFIKLDIDPPSDGRLILEVVRTENIRPERYDFAVNQKPQWPLGEFVIGLTGKQAGAFNWRPIAWRVSAVDAKGKVLASRHSFLWGATADLDHR